MSCVSFGIIEKRIFNYPDALLANFSIESSDIKNSRLQNGVGFGWVPFLRNLFPRKALQAAAQSFPAQLDTANTRCLCLAPPHV